MEARPIDGAFAYASWPRRVLSAVLDSFVISLLAIPFSGDAVRRLLDAVGEGSEISSADLRTATLTNLVVTVVYMTVMHGWRGSTIGKMALRTVLVRDDGGRVTASTAFVRAVTVAGVQLVSGLLLFPIVVDELWPLWNRRRQTLHDLVARTIVVRAGTALPVERAG